MELFMSDKQLINIDRNETIWKAKNGLALRLKELAVASGYSYSQWRIWKAQGLPLIAGRIPLKKAQDWIERKAAQERPEDQPEARHLEALREAAIARLRSK